MPKFNIGDKVVLKTVEEILALKEFKLDSHRGNIDYANGDQVLLWDSELHHCGKEFEIVDVKIANGHVILEDKTGYRVANISPLALKPIGNLVDLQTAVKALKSGECDAIRFEGNKFICAYLGDKGVFKKAIIQNNPKTLNYTNQPFFMHEDYLFDSRWELVVDEYKRKHVVKLAKAKEELIESLDKFYLLSVDFRNEDHDNICKLIKSLKN